MTQDQVAILTLWIQAAAVVAAVGAAIVALVVGWLDRKASKAIAAADRADALRQAKLMFDLDKMLRLLYNVNRGGSTDDLERAQLGAEQLTLVGLLGKDRVPELWDLKIGSEDHLRELLDKPDHPDFRKQGIRVQLAMNELLDEIRESVDRR
jgi:hypothetical protein